MKALFLNIPFYKFAEKGRIYTIEHLFKICCFLFRDFNASGDIHC